MHFPAKILFSPLLCHSFCGLPHNLYRNSRKTEILFSPAPSPYACTLPSSISDSFFLHLSLNVGLTGDSSLSLSCFHGFSYIYRYQLLRHIRFARLLLPSWLKSDSNSGLRTSGSRPTLTSPWYSFL